MAAKLLGRSYTVRAERGGPVMVTESETAARDYAAYLICETGRKAVELATSAYCLVCGGAGRIAKKRRLGAFRECPACKGHATVGLSNEVIRGDGR